MKPRLVHYSDVWNRGLYVAIENNLLHYIAVVKHMEGHLCVYLNLRRELWNENLVLRDKFDISYEGIGSDILNVPSSVLSHFPLDEEIWWIGFDYYQKSKPSEEQVLDRAVELIRAIFVDKMVLEYVD